MTEDKELKISKSRMLEAAKSCDAVKKVLETFWPEEFKKEKVWKRFTPKIRNESGIASGYSFFYLYDEGVYFANVKSTGGIDVLSNMKLGYRVNRLKTFIQGSGSGDEYVFEKLVEAA
jgi:hypothetical protein